MDRKHRIERHYHPRITPERENFDVLDWADAASQRARFAVLAGAIDLTGRRLLDVGCGLGDLLAYLQERGLDVEYTGVDILDRMVQAARKQHPGVRFLCADLFADIEDDGPADAARPDDPGGATDPGVPATPVSALFREHFDVAFCSGVFNLDLGNSGQFLPRAVRRLLDMVRGHVVLNLLHIRTERKYDHCVYHDPAEVLRALADLPCKVRLIEDYLPNDFTVVCTKRF